jgi:uncharacterized membrane protein YdbT with pleckstrin-like domain
MEKTLKPDPRYLTKGNLIFLTITAVTVISFTIVHLIIALTSGDREAIAIIWIVAGSSILAMWLIGWPLMYIWIKNLEYTIYNDRVSIHKGILTKTRQNIPFRAITDFALVRTLYDRALGIGSIKVQTAGKHISSGSMYEGNLAGLLEYDQLHAELREKVKSLHPSSGPLATADAEVKPEGDIMQKILRELQDINRNLSGK